MEKNQPFSADLLVLVLAFKCDMYRQEGTFIGRSSSKHPWAFRGWID